MGVEIERKFLVEGHSWRNASGVIYRQGYLNSYKERTIRIRVIGKNEAFITIKTANIGPKRVEYEYSIPVDDAHEILDTICEKPLIEKIRYMVNVNNFIFEVDEFLNENVGLIIAEIELEYESQHFTKPVWLGKEVTDDPRYYNSNLIKYPYTKWPNNA